MKINCIVGLVLILLMLPVVAADNTAVYENSYGRITIYPNMIYSNYFGCQSINFTSYMPAQDLDIAVRIDSGHITTNTVHYAKPVSTSRIGQNGTTYPCSGYNDNISGMQDELCIDRNNISFDWNFIRWVNIKSLFQIQQYNGKDYHFITDVNFNTDETKSVRWCYFYDKGTQVKYDILVKRSADSLIEAYQNGHYVLIDPGINDTSGIYKIVNVTESFGIARDFEIVNFRGHDICVNVTADYCRADRTDIQFYNQNLTEYTRDIVRSSAGSYWLAAVMPRIEANADNYGNMSVSYNNSLLNKPDDNVVLLYDDGYNFTDGILCEDNYETFTYGSGGTESNCSYISQKINISRNTGDAALSYFSLNLTEFLPASMNYSVGWRWNSSHYTGDIIMAMGYSSNIRNDGYPEGFINYCWNNTGISTSNLTCNPGGSGWSNTDKLMRAHIFRVDYNGSVYRTYIDGINYYNHTAVKSEFYLWGGDPGIDLNANIYLDNVYIVDYSALAAFGLDLNKQDFISYTNVSISYNPQVDEADTTPPQIILENPANHSWNETTQVIDFYYNATDVEGVVNNCSLVISGSYVMTEMNVGTGTGNLTYNISSDGFIYWNINCTDDSDNLNSSLAYELNITTAFPASNQSYPDDNFRNDSGNFTIQCNASDDFNLSGIRLLIYNGSDVLKFDNSSFATGFVNYSMFSFNHNVNGTYSWECLANDSSGRITGSGNYSLVVGTISTVTVGLAMMECDISTTGQSLAIVGFALIIVIICLACFFIRIPILSIFVGFVALYFAWYVAACFLFANILFIAIGFVVIGHGIMLAGNKLFKG